MFDIKTIKAVIFDMDGLMFNSEDVYRAATNIIAKRRGKIFSDAIHQQMMGRSALEDTQILVDEWGLNETSEVIFNEREVLYKKIVDKEIVAEKGLFDLLNILEKRSIRKCIATGSVKEIADINLSIFDLQDRFEFILSGESVIHGKPDPEVYNLAINRLELASDECLVLEDSINGTKSGKAAGCRVFSVPNKYSKNLDYSDADTIFDDLSQIAELFN